MHKTKLVLETGRATDRLTVRIRDEVSRTMIASFDLTPELWWQTCGGGTVDVEGMITDHFDRVGKTMEVTSEEFSHEDLAASTYDQQLADAEMATRADRPGWDEYNARRTNAGTVHVTLRRWR
jgi:hypothetical protein